MPMPRMVPRQMPPAPSAPSAPPVPSVPPQMPSAPAGSMEDSPSEGMGDPGMNPMGPMDLAQVRQRLLQDPSYLQQLLQEIQVANPQLYQALQQNPQALLQLIMGGAGGAPRPRHGGIQVTPEEKGAIDRVHVLSNCNS